MSDFKLEHGKRYVTRGGSPTDGVVFDVRKAGWNETSCFWGMVDGTGCLWTETGLRYRDGSESNNDLVAEYVPPPEPKWVPFENAEEASVLLGQMVRYRGDPNGVAALVVSVSYSFIRCGVEYTPTFEIACERWVKVSDGTPCGKQVP